MFVVLLKFSENKSKASDFMDEHNKWIKSGFDEGVFVLVGGLQPKLGGGVIAHNISREDLENRVNEDPFVKEGVVTAEILEITPAKLDPRLEFLK